MQANPHDNIEHLVQSLPRRLEAVNAATSIKILVFRRNIDLCLQTFDCSVYIVSWSCQYPYIYKMLLSILWVVSVCCPFEGHISLKLIPVLINVHTINLKSHCSQDSGPLCLYCYGFCHLFSAKNASFYLKKGKANLAQSQTEVQLGCVKYSAGCIPFEMSYISHSSLP